MRRSSFTDNGLFNSPNYPSPYPPLINCILYTFIGYLEDIVELHFIDFNTQSQITNRCSDYLKFFLDLKKPEVNEREEWNYEMCGNMSMVAIKHYSSTPYLIFEFHTDNVHTNHTGFKGTFAFYKKSNFETSTNARWGSTCIYDFNSSNFLHKGQFFSPSYPQNYLPNSHCLYHFYGKSGERVALLFNDIELEEHDGNCEDSPDQILIRDGTDLISPVLTRFCGIQTSEKVISSYNAVVVEFKSDSRKQRKGFSANFKFFSSSKVSLNDKVESNSKQNVKLFDSEARNMSVIGESWKQDIEFELQEPLVAKDFPAEFVLMNENKIFTLQSLLINQSPHPTLFTPLHQISPKCNHTYDSLQSKSGYFTSPGYPTSYPSQIVCRYMFQGMENERIQLVFVDFRLSGPEERVEVDPHECEEFDTLIVSIVIKGDTRNLINQCGHKIPYQLMSHDNRMEVIFSSKHREIVESNTRGFKANYKFVTDFGITSGLQDDDMECGFTYRSELSKNGTFTSPNFPGLYPRNTECHYLFYGKHLENILITFTTFDVEGISPECGGDTQSDYVEFSNFNVQLTDRKMIRTCGARKDQIRKSVSSDGNFFRVTFKSNDVYDSTGFAAFYQFKYIEDPMTNKIQKSESNNEVQQRLIYQNLLNAISILYFIF